VKLEGEGKLLRLFIGEADHLDHKPLYEQFVRKAREMGMAGATVLRGVESFGARSRVVHTAKILRLSEDLPLIVEIVDTEAKIDEFATVAGEMLERAGCGGLITEERAHVIRYTPGRQPEAKPG
jgi:PII-like signaling protein